MPDAERQRAGAHADQALGRPARLRGHRGLPGERRLGLHHRHGDPGGRRLLGAGLSVALRCHAADLRGALARPRADAGAEHALPRLAQPGAGDGRGAWCRSLGMPDGLARHRCSCAAAGITAALLSALCLGRAAGSAARSISLGCAWQCVRPGGQPVLRAAADAAGAGARGLFCHRLRHGGAEPEGGAVLHRRCCRPFLDPERGQRLRSSKRGASARWQLAVCAAERRGAGLGRRRHRALPRRAAVLDGRSSAGCSARRSGCSR